MSRRSTRGIGLGGSLVTAKYEHITGAATMSAATAAGTAFAFSPAELSGMSLWYRSDNVTQTGNVMSAMADLSGNSNPAVVVGTGPTYAATDVAYNGLPSITQSVAHTMQSTSNVTLGPFTFIWVGLCTAGPGYGATHVSDSGADYAYLYYSTGASYSIARTSVTSAYNVGSSWLVSPSARTIAARFAGAHDATQNIRINGVNQSLSSVGAGVPGTGTTAVGKFAMYSKVGGSSAIAGSYAEFLVFNRALSDAEMVNVEGYLRRRYNHY